MSDPLRPQYAEAELARMQALAPRMALAKAFLSRRLTLGLDVPVVAYRASVTEGQVLALESITALADVGAMLAVAGVLGLGVTLAPAPTPEAP